MILLLLFFLSFSQVTHGECLYNGLKGWRSGQRSVDGGSSQIMVKNLKKTEITHFLQKFSQSPVTEIGLHFWLAETSGTENKMCRKVMVNFFEADKDNGFMILSSFVDSAEIFKKALEKNMHPDLTKQDFFESLNVRYEFGGVIIKVQNLQTMLSRSNIVTRIGKIMLEDGFDAITSDGEQSQSNPGSELWYKNVRAKSLRQVTISANQKNSEVVIYESTAK